MVSALVVPVPNELQGSVSAYVEKRPGLNAAGDSGSAAVGTIAISTVNFSVNIAAFGATNSTIYYGTPLIGPTNSAGTMTGQCFYMTEVIFSSMPYILMPSTDGTGWFLAEDSTDQTSYVGDTHSNTTIDGIASTAGIYVGQAWTGSGIPAGTRVAQVNSANAITITQAATATAGGVTFTKTPMAKIIDADFPSMVGQMVELGGRIFVTTALGVIHQSDLNSVTSWTAAGTISANMDTDNAIGLVRQVNQIICVGGGSLQWFYNAGNPSGSVLSSTPNAFKKIGASGRGAASFGAHPIDYYGDDIFFVGSATGPGRMVYRISGFEITPISPPVIGDIVVTADVYTYSIGGLAFLYIPGKTTIHLLYCLETKRWSEPGYAGRYAFGKAPKNASNLGEGPGFIAVSTSSTTGKIYTISNSSDWDDDGTAYTMTIQLSDGGFGEGGPKHVAFYELVADTQASGATTLEISDNDGQNYTTVGTFDMTQEQKRVWTGGFYYGHRMVRLTHSANTAWRGQFIDVWGAKAAA